MAGREIMTILVSIHFGTSHNFKHYYLLYVKEHLDNVFPIKRNRVFKGLAETGKSTMRWLFGFKLHFACNEWGRTFEFMLYAREN